MQKKKQKKIGNKKTKETVVERKEGNRREIERERERGGGGGGRGTDRHIDTDRHRRRERVVVMREKIKHYGNKS